MPTITWKINRKTGEMTTDIKGISGTGCQPIHKRISKDLAQYVGIQETSVEPTPEMYGAVAQNTVSVQQGR